MIRPVIAVICSLFIAVSVFAQGGIPLKTGKKYVTAIVDHGSGWVHVKVFPGNTIDGSYSYPQKSFVSFNVNGKVYTNNDVGLPSPLPANTFIMKDGVLKKTGDTIRCTWPNKDGFDLIQEVYPVLFERSEQIVFRWKALNKGSNSVIVSVQYLLDVQVGVQGNVNDRPPILTRYSSNHANWDVYTPTTGTGIPWLYAAFQNELPNAPTFDPGLTGVGYTDNTFANLGLTKPSRQTIGDWIKLIEVRWGPPVPLPNGSYNDAATLLEFTGATAIPNKETLLAATSYGSGEFGTCKGQLFGIIFFPLRINWEPPNLYPDPITIEFYAFNPQHVAGAPNTTLTLTVGPNLTITGPSPVTNGGKTQVQSVQVGGYIPPNGVGIASWTVKPTKEGQCSTDIISSLKFVGTSPGLGYPVFVNEVNAGDTCEHPIIIECAKQDQLPPVLDPFVIASGGDKQITAHDDRVATDTGLKSITWIPTAGTDSSKFTIIINPPVQPCSKAKHTVTLHQIDTTIGGCIDLRFEDCAGNKKDTTVCFVGKTYIPPDTIPPIIVSRTTKDKLTKEIVVSDPVENSSMMGSVLNQPLPTLPSFNQNILFNTNCTMFGGRITVQRIDSLQAGCVYYTISDCAGNTMVDSICFLADTSLGVTDNQNENAFSILGNPSSGRATIHLALERAQDVTLRIVDALGREVRRVEVKGLSLGENLIPLQTSELASGTYYIIVEIDGKQFTKSLKVVR